MVKRCVFILLLGVFFFSAGFIAVTLNRYQADEKLYAEAAEQYVYRVENEEGNNKRNVASGAEMAPINVDFESLKKVNSNIIGWIYCEDTAISYPVLRGTDDNTYLHRNYKGGYSAAGSIFVDSANQGNFADSNTIIYGHNMKNGSMFASLKYWMDQEFYEEHPVMWLLTPEQNYKIVLFSGYATSAYSDTYTIFSGPCEELNDYLGNCVRQSKFQADMEPDINAKYVLLSTCAYMSENARYVLHGMLIPVSG